MPEVIIVLFNRDLRITDHPALHQACQDARQVVPLFVIDPAIPPRGRAGFLAECLEDLRRSLRERGADLVVRRGDVVEETMKVAAETGATAIYASGDVTARARKREGRFARENIGFQTFPGITIVPPAQLKPATGDHYRVFTPFYRAWSEIRWRPLVETPETISMPEVRPGDIPPPHRRPHLPGGEHEVRRRLDLWLRHCLRDYADGHDDLAGDHTSRLSPYLRFGCVSPLELATRSGASEEFVRQLCWRDFYAQVTFAFPRINRDDYRPARGEWHHDKEAEDAWREGMTGVPVVDAGMRQLIAEGWMHNRARLIVASFLTKTLRIDWRVGADHFEELLLDGDVANNYGNWQWVAGTGNDTRPYRMLSPVRQAKKFDKDGEYIRRYVPELENVPTATLHEPWRAPSPILGYTSPIWRG
ncbi:deoxyribodipyrimidine photo-lyase [Herbidospora sp. NBRC 101105]|uniref:cryptochrome/photolyase family protein n=1 Tax=Herbidospora sp. NBRC 101105 TaxID=3032195 RepID=UPI0024A0D895|nr:deoxyribodipyrimidine photo-lyase [Herbidospora sp. NBRC 101105]GLX98257.1 deoxyribodipyrimidine photo-lyase [Herbidospora sp. NBRC 101105]